MRYLNQNKFYIRYFPRLDLNVLTDSGRKILQLHGI